MESYNKVESVRKHLRVFLYDSEGKNIIKYNRKDTYETSIDNSGYEDLLLNEDQAKINLYNTSEFITLYNNKTYKVIRREFMPCIPVTLYLFLEEV